MRADALPMSATIAANSRILEISEDTISEQVSGIVRLCAPQRRGPNTW